MRHARIERWSRGDSPIHRRHAAAKILATIVILLCLATVTSHAGPICLLYLCLLIAALATARLPVFEAMATAARVLPFALCFAAVTALAGEPLRALVLVARGYLSALTALLLIATTPIPRLIAGLELLRVPRFLLQVMQFLYRYLIVLMEEAATMREAGACRAGSIRTLRMRQAAAMAGVLFARSFGRAEAIHRAMLARGFNGTLPLLETGRMRVADAGLVAGTTFLTVGIQVMFL